MLALLTRKWSNEEEVALFPTDEENTPSYNAFDEDIGVLNIYFESPTCFEYIRWARMTIVDFIAQIGGLFGACIGFSFISAFEIIYWFTFRLVSGPRRAPTFDREKRD